MSKVSTVTHKALEVARAMALEVPHVGQDGPTRFAFKRSYCRLGVSNRWVWVGIKWVGPLKPNSPFKLI